MDYERVCLQFYKTSKGFHPNSAHGFRVKKEEGNSILPILAKGKEFNPYKNQFGRIEGRLVPWRNG